MGNEKKVYGLEAEGTAPVGNTGGETTTYKNLGFCGFAVGANASCVDVKNGRIVRVRPLHWDEKYEPEEMRPWKIEARGKTFEPTMKSLLPPFSLAYKKRAYSPNRILYRADDEEPPSALQPRVQEEGLFAEQDTLPDEARRLGPERRA